MKIKKEYIILILIIAALSAYLFFQNKGSTHYTLPEIRNFNKDDVSKITIKKGGSEITLVREDDRWVITPQNYLASASKTDKMLNDIKLLKLTALASESKNYLIYELDEKHRIEVAAYNGDSIINKFYIGKIASSHNHSFIQIDNDYKIYHAMGNLKNMFDQRVSDLRDKTIMKIDEEIQEIALTKDNKKMLIFRGLPPVDVKNANTQEKEDQKPVSKWKNSKGDPLKGHEVDEIVTILSNLQCDDYIEKTKKQDFSSPHYTITLKGTKEYTLSIFSKKENKYECISSESEYPFYIFEWKAKKVMKDFKDFS